MIRLTAILLLIPVLTCAQKRDFRIFDVRNGLPQVSVSCIYQDSRQILWVGTQGGGVAYYDGNKIHALDERVGFPTKIITGITEDKQGRILVIGTWGGLVRYNGKSHKQFTEAGDLEIKGINDFTWKEDTLLLATEKGLIAFYDDSLYPIETYHFESKALQSICYSTKRKQVIISDEEHVYLLSSKSKVITIEAPTEINQISVSRHDEPLLATDDGVYTISGNAIVPKGLQGQPINYVQDCKDGLWACGDNIYILDSLGGVSTLGVTDGLPPTTKSCVLTDNNNNIWIGSMDYGLINLQRNGFRYFDSMSALNFDDFFGCIEFEETIFFASATHGISMYSPKQRSSKHFPRTQFQNGSVGTFTMYNGSLLAGTSNGLYKYNGEKFSHVHIEFDELGETPSIRFLAEDKKGRLWIGTKGDGLFYTDDFQSATRVKEVGLKAYIHSGLVASDGSLWFGTGAGVFHVVDGNFIHYQSELCNSYIGSITEDNAGRIWLGTDNCINIWNKGKITSLTYKDGLNSNTIFSLIKGKSGAIYAGTNRGINKIEPLNDGSFKITQMGVQEGFRGVECNTRAALAASDGTLYFGTVYGVNAFIPSKAKMTSSQPRIFINNIEILLENIEDTLNNTSNNSWINDRTTLKLPYNQNHFAVELGVVDLAGVDRIEYSYFLEGFDKTWGKASKHSRAVYTNLPSGKYTFRAKARIAGGEWSDPIEYGPIVIEASPPLPPRFYKTWWFYVIVGIPILLIFYYLIIIRPSQLQKTKRHLTHQVQERTKEITQQKEEKEVLLKEIHHRVKNNLQVINSLLNLQASYIEDKEALKAFEECKNRITSMALIHEKMYETTNLAEINFNDYITELSQNLLTTYAVNKDVELEIDATKTVYRIDTLVPLGIILNEILTNSLKYAFANKDTGKIYIHLKRENGYFMLNVGDNGVGMPNDFVLEESETLGLQLIQILTEQIEGEAQLINDNGVHYLIKFKALKTDEQ